MDGSKYVLTEKLNYARTSILMQDAASCHRSQIATELLNKDSMFEMGLMETLWTIMKDNVAYKQSSNARNLGQDTKEVWITEITQGYCRYQLFNMPCRLTVVIEIKTGRITY